MKKNSNWNPFNWNKNFQTWFKKNDNATLLTQTPVTNPVVNTPVIATPILNGPQNFEDLEVKFNNDEKIIEGKINGNSFDIVELEEKTANLSEKLYGTREFSLEKTNKNEDNNIRKNLFIIILIIVNLVAIGAEYFLAYMGIQKYKGTPNETMFLTILVGIGTAIVGDLAGFFLKRGYTSGKSIITMVGVIFFFGGLYFIWILAGMRVDYMETMKTGNDMGQLAQSFVGWLFFGLVVAFSALNTKESGKDNKTAREIEEKVFEGYLNELRDLQKEAENLEKEVESLNQWRADHFNAISMAEEARRNRLQEEEINHQRNLDLIKARGENPIEEVTIPESSVTEIIEDLSFNPENVEFGKLESDFNGEFGRIVQILEGIPDKSKANLNRKFSKAKARVEAVLNKLIPLAPKTVNGTDRLQAMSDKFETLKKNNA